MFRIIFDRRCPNWLRKLVKEGVKVSTNPDEMRRYLDDVVWDDKANRDPEKKQLAMHHMTVSQLSFACIVSDYSVTYAVVYFNQ